MNDKTIRLILQHLAAEPALVAVSPLEVAELRGLGYLTEDGLSLTEAGTEKLASLVAS